MKKDEPDSPVPDLSEAEFQAGDFPSVKVPMTEEIDPSDVRCAVRFPVHLPVQVVTDGGEYQAQTENVSASGVLFLAKQAIEIDSTVELFLRMPAKSIGATEDVVVQCVGRVTRCSNDADGVHVAALIDDYRVGREA